MKFRVAAAESSGLANDSVDLVTVGQALHWFELQTFFAEVGRVLKEHGVLAVWCYQLCNTSDDCDVIIDELYDSIVGEFWLPERDIVDGGYKGIAFPGRAIDAPGFEMLSSWYVDDVLGYLRTWSATKRYEAVHGEDPVAIIEASLRSAWGHKRRKVRWPLAVFVRRIESS